MIDAGHSSAATNATLHTVKLVHDRVERDRRLHPRAPRRRVARLDMIGGRPAPTGSGTFA
jgi:hypothetical protein